MNTTQRAALASMTIADVRTVYSGRPGCACGCRGKHTANPAHRAEAGKNRGYAYNADECNEREIKRVLANVQGQPVRVEADDDCAWFSVETDTRLFIVYPCDAAVARFAAHEAVA